MIKVNKATCEGLPLMKKELFFMEAKESKMLYVKIKRRLSPEYQRAGRGNRPGYFHTIAAVDSIYDIMRWREMYDTR